VISGLLVLGSIPTHQPAGNPLISEGRVTFAQLREADTVELDTDVLGNLGVELVGLAVLLTVVDQDVPITDVLQEFDTELLVSLGPPKC